MQELELVLLGMILPILEAQWAFVTVLVYLFGEKFV